MSNFYTRREGMTVKEQMAHSILSKFSFVAKPSTTLDDVGADFFCTLFKIVDNRLIPQNSFAIQIKSNKRSVNITDKIIFLNNLEIPYFVGVVDINSLKLEIYSGESIDHFLSRFGEDLPERENVKVFIKLLDSNETNFYEIHGRRYYLNFPKILEIEANFDYRNSNGELNGLFEICSLIQDNISSRKNTEYLYKVYKHEKNGVQQVVVYAGRGSYLTFKGNFFKRLAEVFCNLKWIYQNPNLKFDQKEFEMYERIYHDLRKCYGSSPYLDFAEGFYEELRSLIENNR